MEDKIGKDIINGIEYLSSNVDSILDWLETNANKKNEPVNDNINFISNEITSFTTYLERIDNNILKINNNINGFLENINPSNIEEIDSTNESELTLNISNVLGRIDELLEVLTNNEYNTNTINIEGLEKLKTDIQDISVNVNIDNINTIKESIDNILSSIDDYHLNIDFGQSIENIKIIKQELDSINSFDFNIDMNILNIDNFNKNIDTLERFVDNKYEIDLSIKSNITSIIDDLKQLKNIDFESISTINLNIDTDKFQKDLDIVSKTIDKTLLKLDDLKNIDFSDINVDLTWLDKIGSIDLSINLESFEQNIVSINNSIKNINNNVILELSINSNIDKLNSDIKALVDNIEPLDVDINARVNIDLNNNMIDSIVSDLESYNFSIKPSIDISELEDFQFKNDAKFTPIIDEQLIRFIHESDNIELNNIQQNDNGIESLKKYLTENNKMLGDLTKAILDSNKKSNIIETNTINEVKNQTSIMNNTTETSESKSDINNDDIKVLLSQMLEIQIAISQKINKPSFNMDLNF